jgi:hypothetical protein
MGRIIDRQTARQIARELDAAPHFEKGAIVARWCELYRCNPVTVYRAAADTRGAKKTIERSVRIPQRYIDLVARLKLRVAETGLEDRELATAICIEVLEHSGQVPVGLLKPTTVNTRLREAGFRLEDPRVRVEYDFANQVWLMDFSRSKYFQVQKYVKGDYVLKISGRHLHYKENDQLRNLWLVQVKDGFSRVRLGRGYVDSGENALLGLGFLDWAFSRPVDDVVLRGVPHHLKVDQGAFGKHELTETACAALGVDLRLTTPYAKESQGAIELSWKLLWRQFEMKLVAQYGKGWTITLSDYNELMLAHLAADAQQRHPHLKQSRELVYRTSLACTRPDGVVPLRTVDESILTFACRPIERSVDDAQRVRIDHEYFSVPREAGGRFIQEGTRLRILKSAAGRFMARTIDWYSDFFELAPWQAARWDDFSGRAGTTYRQEQTRLMHEAVKSGTAVPARPERPLVATLPPREERIEVASPFASAAPEAPATLTYDQARQRIGRALMQLTGQGYGTYERDLDRLVYDGMPVEAADLIITQLRTALAA